LKKNKYRGRLLQKVVQKHNFRGGRKERMEALKPVGGVTLRRGCRMYCRDL